VSVDHEPMAKFAKTRAELETSRLLASFRFRLLEIHRDVENPRAHIQLICDWRIKPVEVVALSDIEPAAS
jgi:hypothetical protein